MNHAVISAGSNTADNKVQINEAIKWLKSTLLNVKVSRVYSTRPLSNKGNDYANAVISGNCDDDYETINASLKRHEAECGRDEACKMSGNVPIDLDIVVWNGKVMREKDYNQDFFKIGWEEICK
jgi:2-amino-4-hydroxy-6-hydroxymethyldihydropteridine diphosphokinase